MEYGLKLTKPMHFGDVLSMTPIVKYLSQKHNTKILLETLHPIAFKNNPYVKKIFDISKGETLPEDIIVWNCTNHRTPVEGHQKAIRKYPITEYWAYNLGFVLAPEEKTLEFYPDPLDIELPKKDYVVLHPSLTDACRTWDLDKWQKLINLIKENTTLDIVVMGREINHNDGSPTKGVHNIKDPDPRVINIINKDTLSQAWYYIENSVATITMDSGILHLAGTTNANIIVPGSPINPYYRLPWRKGSQYYKQYYVGGDCKLFCQSDIKYNVPGIGGKLNAGFPPPGKCYENKPTFECHPTPDSVFKVLTNIIKDMKHELKEYEHLLETDNWFDYAQLYSDVVRDFPNFKNFVEVGCWKGHSISYLAELLKSREGVKISAVDIWDDGVNLPGYIYLGPDEDNEVWKYLYSIYNENLTRKGVRDLITDYKQCSWEGAENFEDESIDFCFIDAGHAYEEVIKDINAYLPKMKKTGIIAGHDYHNKIETGVRKAVDEIFNNNVHSPDGICWWVHMKDLTNIDKSKIIYFKNRLESFSEKNELSLLTHTIHEHYGEPGVSILLVGDISIQNQLKIFYDNVTVFNSNDLSLSNKEFDVIIFNSNKFLTENSLLYKTISSYNTHSKSLVCFRNSNFSKTIRNINEYFKIDLEFSRVADFNKEINTTVYIKEPNVLMNVDTNYINQLSLDHVSIIPDKQTLPVLFELIKGVNINIKDDLTIEVSTIADLEEVNLTILNNTGKSIYSKNFNLKPQLRYWFGPRDQSYLDGFTLILSKNNYCIYKQSFTVENNKILK